MARRAPADLARPLPEQPRADGSRADRAGHRPARSRRVAPAAPEVVGPAELYLRCSKHLFIRLTPASSTQVGAPTARGSTARFGRTRMRPMCEAGLHGRKDRSWGASTSWSPRSTGCARRCSTGELASDDERARLRTVEEALDQCWDLLRRRRAARDNGTRPRHGRRPARSPRWRATCSSAAARSRPACR